jgi:hypothetical protein
MKRDTLVIPHVFVSSTVDDLAHLREAIKDTIEALGYRAILSEHNGVGYVPPLSAIDSCFEAMRDCQAAVLIIGKRYGRVSDDGGGLSVTHGEFRHARERGIPVFCLVDREVLAYKKVHDHAKGNVPAGFPEMSAASRTFALIDEVERQPENNGWLPYQGAAEACSALKQQLAHYVGRLLRTTNDPVHTQINDVLAQVVALRGELQRSLPETVGPEPYVRGATILISDSYKQLRTLMSAVSRGVEAAVGDLLRWPTFTEYLKGRNASVTATESPLAINAGTSSDMADRRTASWFLTSEDFLSGHVSGEGEVGQQYEAHFVVYRDHRVEMNHAARRYFEIVYASARAMALDK